MLKTHKPLYNNCQNLGTFQLTTVLEQNPAKRSLCDAKKYVLDPVTYVKNQFYWHGGYIKIRQSWSVYNLTLQKYKWI